MRSNTILAATAALGVLAATPSLAAVVYSNTFNAGSTTGFTGGTVTTAPSGEKFLAGITGGATLAVSGLAPATAVTLSFTIDAVGSLDGGPNPAFGGGPGDFFTVTDATGSSTGMSFNFAFANYGNGETQTYPTAGSAPEAGATTVNALGYTGFPQGSGGAQDAEYTITLSPITNSNGSISFTFTDNSNEGVGNEFYGIDNVVVNGTTPTVTTPVPEPMTLALLGSGLLGVVAMRRRRA